VGWLIYSSTPFFSVSFFCPQTLFSFTTCLVLRAKLLFYFFVHIDTHGFEFIANCFALKREVYRFFIVRSISNKACMKVRRLNSE
jgi:hypothetical protein